MPYVPSPKSRRSSAPSLSTFSLSSSPSSVSEFAKHEHASPSPVNRDNGHLSCIGRKLSEMNISSREGSSGDSEYNDGHFIQRNNQANVSSSFTTPASNPPVPQVSPLAEDALPLSLSFIRRPSRSASMDLDVDIERIMKHNTLINSRSFTSQNPPSSPELSEPSSPRQSSFDDDMASPISPLVSQTESNHQTCRIPAGYTSPLVRKKSGELLKSSLRLNAAFKSSGAVSMPTTPTYKQVHFGTNIHVKYFDEKDKPSSISAGNSPFNSDDDLLGEDDEEDVNTGDEDEDDNDNDNDNDNDDDNDDDTQTLVEGSEFDTSEMECRVQLCKKFYKYSKKLVEQDSLSHLEKFKKVARIWDLDLSEFSMISYRDQIDCEVPVFVERCFLNLHKTKVIGQIAVKNISFDKSVKVRYTYDNWNTVINVDAEYTSDIPRVLKRAGYDRFVFELSTPFLISMFFQKNSYRSEPAIYFCIQYTSGNQEFWDNNHSKNYTLRFLIDTRQNSSFPDQEPLKKCANDPNCPNDSYFHHTGSTKVIRNHDKTTSENIPHPTAEKNKNSAYSIDPSFGKLKRSRSFDKRTNVSKLIKSPEFIAKGGTNQDLLKTRSCSPTSLRNTGLKDNFLNQGIDPIDSSGLKDENEYILFRLREVKNEEPSDFE
ncbi:hypothetical protein JL09_g4603, partial [Pichia kudriavzevii]